MKGITKFLFSIFGLMILSTSFMSAACSVNLNKEVYSPSETAKVIMNCSGGMGENYYLNWTDSSGNLLEQDTGVLPTANTNFYQTYNIPSDYLGIIKVILFKNINGIRGLDSAEVVKFITLNEDKNVEHKHKGSSCVTRWVWNTSLNDWVKEDWTHPVIKKIILEKGMDSPEYNKWKNHWKTIPGKYCVAVGENGRKVNKPTYIPSYVQNYSKEQGVCESE